MRVKMIKEAYNDVLEIDDCQIMFRNFKGEETAFNRKGDRNFAVILDDEAYNILKDTEWNVKVKINNNDEPYYFLPVKVKLEGYRPPVIYIQNMGKTTVLDNENIGILDEIGIKNVKLDLRSYDWTVNNKNGRAAYLKSMLIVKDTDRFEAMQNNKESETIEFDDIEF